MEKKPPLTSIIFLSLIILFGTLFPTHIALAKDITPSSRSPSSLEASELNAARVYSALTREDGGLSYAIRSPIFHQSSSEDDGMPTTPSTSSLPLSEPPFMTSFNPNYFSVSPSPVNSQLPTKTFDSNAPTPTSSVTGTRNVLVILIDFPDRAGSKSHTYYQNLLFNNSVGSLKHYYEEVSYGKFTINGTIVGHGNGTDWYRSTKNMAYWGADKTGSSDHDDANDHIYNLAKEAIGKADNDVNFTVYDKDKDGVLQTSELSIWIIHAGSGQESTPTVSDNIWSHRWAISGDFSVDGVRVSLRSEDEDVGYTMEAEDSPMGTFAHEFGHELGLPDLYNTGGSPEFVGKWDIMATGSWNGIPLGSSPAHFTSWSKIKLGWINTSAITTIATRQVVNVTINLLEASNVSVIKVPIDSTYYLVEARRQILYDSSLPSYGVLILYCDDSIASGKGPVRVMNAHPSDTTLNRATFNVGTGENSTFIDASKGIAITVLSASSSSFKIKVNYNASKIRISTSPLGLTIQVDGTNYTAPNVFTWMSGSTHTINVPDIQGNGSMRCLFLGWSDGGGRTHTIIANVSDVTITANYRVQYFLDVSSPYGVISGSGWYDNGTVAYTGLSVGVVDAGVGARFRFSHWGNDSSGRNFDRSDAILMNGSKTAVAYWKRQYETSLIFKTSSNLSDLSTPPMQCQIVGAPPNSTLITVREYSHVWLDDVNWTAVQVLWQGNNVIPYIKDIYLPTPLGKWFILTNVYWLNLTFSDSSGMSLYIGPSNYTIVFPNGTQFAGRTTLHYPQVQNGTITITSVTWQGSEVVPKENTLSIQPPQGRGLPQVVGVIWSVRCRVYRVDFSTSFKDGDSGDLDINPSSFSLLSPNGTKTKSLSVGIYTLQNGTYLWDSIIWKGVNVVPSPSPIFHPSDGNPKANCRIYDLTINVKDVFGLAVADANVEVRLTNGTMVASGMSDSSGKTTFPQLPVGSYGIDVWFLGFRTGGTVSLIDVKSIDVGIFLSYPMVWVILGIAFFLTIMSLVTLRIRGGLFRHRKTA